MVFLHFYALFSTMFSRIKLCFKVSSLFYTVFFTLLCLQPIAYAQTNTQIEELAATLIDKAVTKINDRITNHFERFFEESYRFCYASGTNSSVGIVTKIRHHIVSSATEEVVDILASWHFNEWSVSTDASNYKKLKNNLVQALRQLLSVKNQTNSFWSELLDERLAQKLTLHFKGDSINQLVEIIRDVIRQAEEELSGEQKNKKTLTIARKVKLKLKKANSWIQKVLKIDLSKLRNIAKAIAILTVGVFILKTGDCVEPQSNVYGHLVPCLITTFLDGQLDKAY